MQAGQQAFHARRWLQTMLLTNEELVGKQFTQLLQVRADRRLRLSQPRRGARRALLFGKNQEHFQEVEVDVSEIDHVDNGYQCRLLAHYGRDVITLMNCKKITAERLVPKVYCSGRKSLQTQGSERRFVVSALLFDCRPNYGDLRHPRRNLAVEILDRIAA